MSERTLERLHDALAYAGGTHTINDVVDAIRRGEAQVWERGGSVVVTEIATYPRRRAVRVWLAAGSMRDVLGLFEGPITDFAKAEGCDAAEMVGRPGWERVLSRRGWNMTGITMRKELAA